MRPNQRLINGLRVAADRIEDLDGDYLWSFPASCNCGVLAQVLLGITEKELANVLAHVPSCNWTKGINYLENVPEPTLEGICHITGFNMKDIYNTLRSCGLDNQDFQTLEFLGQTTEEEYYNSDLNKRVNGTWSFDDPHIVAQYFRELADNLEQLLPLYNTLGAKGKDKVVPVTVTMSN